MNLVRAAALSDREARPRDLSAHYALLLAIALNSVIALGLRLWHLDHLSIWLDEAHTALDSTLSARELWLSALTDKPPLYYLITSAFWSPGGSEFDLRLPAALMGVLAVALSCYLGKAIAGARGAVVLGFFFAISMVSVRYSQEARQYILLSLGWVLVTTSLYHFSQGVDGSRVGRRLGWGAFLLGSLVMLHTHLIALIYIPIGLFSCFLALFVSKRLEMATAVRITACFLLAIATVAPWLGALVSRQPAGEHALGWLSNPDAAEAVAIYVRDGAGGRLTLALSVAGFLIYAVRKNLATGLFFLLLAVLPPLSIWVLGFAKPIYMGRTVMLAHVPVLVGLLLLAGASDRKWISGLTVALAAVALALPTWRYFRDFEKEDWRGAARRWMEVEQGRAPIFVERISYFKPLSFYIREQLPDVYFITENSAGETIAVDARQGWKSKCLAFSCDPLARDATDSPEVVWYVARPRDKPGEGMVAGFNDRLNHVTGREYLPDDEWAGHNVYLYRFRKKDDAFSISPGPADPSAIPPAR